MEPPWCGTTVTQNRQTSREQLLYFTFSQVAAWIWQEVPGGWQRRRKEDDGKGRRGITDCWCRIKVWEPTFWKMENRTYCIECECKHLVVRYLNLTSNMGSNALLEREEAFKWSIQHRGSLRLEFCNERLKKWLNKVTQVSFRGWHGVWYEALGGKETPLMCTWDSVNAFTPFIQIWLLPGQVLSSWAQFQVFLEAKKTPKNFSLGHRHQF